MNRLVKNTDIQPLSAPLPIENTLRDRPERTIYRFTSIGTGDRWVYIYRPVFPDGYTDVHKRSLLHKRLLHFFPVR
jgi:hypothetical protein